MKILVDYLESMLLKYNITSILYDTFNKYLLQSLFDRLGYGQIAVSQQFRKELLAEMSHRLINFIISKKLVFDVSNIAINDLLRLSLDEHGLFYVDDISYQRSLDLADALTRAIHSAYLDAVKNGIIFSTSQKESITPVDIKKLLKSYAQISSSSKPRANKSEKQDMTMKLWSIYNKNKLSKF
jgi:hypothetical protein